MNEANSPPCPVVGQRVIFIRNYDFPDGFDTIFRGEIGVVTDIRNNPGTSQPQIVVRMDAGHDDLEDNSMSFYPDCEGVANDEGERMHDTVEQFWYFCDFCDFCDPI